MSFTILLTDRVIFMCIIDKVIIVVWLYTQILLFVNAIFRKQVKIYLVS